MTLCGITNTTKVQELKYSTTKSYNFGRASVFAFFFASVVKEIPRFNRQQILE